MEDPDLTKSPEQPQPTSYCKPVREYQPRGPDAVTHHQTQMCRSAHPAFNHASLLCSQAAATGQPGNLATGQAHRGELREGGRAAEEEDVEVKMFPN